MRDAAVVGWYRRKAVMWVFACLAALTTCGSVGHTLETRAPEGPGQTTPATARGDSDPDLEFLIAELKKEGRTRTQLTDMIATLGRQVVTRLLREYECGTGCDDEVLRVVGSVFSEMGEEAEPAVDPLLAIAKDTQRSLGNRRAAVDALRGIGAPAKSAVPGLDALARQDPENFEHLAGYAIVRIGGRAAVDALLARLKRESSPFASSLALQYLAELGPAARRAGPTLVRFLDHEDQDLRVAAARAIGFVEYRQAATQLIELLDDEANWRLVVVSAESLGRLRARKARGRLRSVTETHWYPAVREVATKALDVIEGRSTYVRKYHRNNFGMEFSHYEWFGSHITACPQSRPRRSPRRTLSALTQALTDELQYEVGDALRRPQLGVRVEDGWLLAVNLGHGAGVTVFLDDDKSQQELLLGHVAGIRALNSGVVAVAGTTSCLINTGWVHKITKEAGGGWSATKWRALPGGPRETSIQDDGRLLVHGYGGSVSIAPDGQMEMASCE